eukprot:CAMPEP_0194762638 /NCGR_PEP_ID=MMETSP0323_2-20130528/16394_1 /TAXON_ID=2866 ORGANISM="Crypthecodinium cohnii, Strain Seligo" /NCGR_SAMPLE_ID=MMETSP0323_2 /ASSEMBLY_ACC=CAM_ASM_000346 /LENGTH=135 /DNA_ID=CAMNT_0039685439 /DNA_START=24 /DNA_END=431 /DNA_ORIENTATION=+
MTMPHLEQCFKNKQLDAKGRPTSHDKNTHTHTASHTDRHVDNEKQNMKKHGGKARKLMWRQPRGLSNNNSTTTTMTKHGLWAHVSCTVQPLPWSLLGKSQMTCRGISKWGQVDTQIKKSYDQSKSEDFGKLCASN